MVVDDGSDAALCSGSGLGGAGAWRRRQALKLKRKGRAQGTRGVVPTTRCAEMSDGATAAQRWRVLALLFAVRAAMAFQFQSVAALGPVLKRDLGFDAADLGLLIGIYLAPGVLLAVPGGSLGRRFGDRTVVMTGLCLMIVGGAAMALDLSWAAQVFGRVLSGIGGVLLNVSMSKMVTDWFAGREIATAMAIFVNSWPVGIALALVVIPLVSIHSSLTDTHLAATLPGLAGLAVFSWLYSAPAMLAVGTETPSYPKGSALAAIVVAGSVWGLYNAAISMIFSFGGLVLMEKGWAAAPASQTTSIVLWLTAISVPLGGVLADRTGRPREVMVGGFLIFATLLISAVQSNDVFFSFAALGLLCGVPAGPIMSLPALALAPHSRSAGMGIF